MTYYIRRGNDYRLSPKRALDIQESLPIGTYTVGIDMMSGEYFLTHIEDFDIPTKLYGNTRDRAERILATFHSRDSGTGVMLTGEKGSGKTLLAKYLSVSGRRQGLSTIVINAPHCGEAFNSFVQQIDEPAIIIFDEFEKVYDREQQQSMLTLFDGVYSSKKLFIVTTNDQDRIDRHMQNRPGRIFYRYDYTNLDANFVREYAEDNLDNKDNIPALVTMATVFDVFNFDILKAVVEEMNRYNETVKDVMEHLNVRPSITSAYKSYTLAFHIKGKNGLPDVKFTDDDWYGNLFAGVDYYLMPIREDDSENEKAPKAKYAAVFEQDYGFTPDPDGDINLRFGPSNMKSLDGKTGKFTFDLGNGHTVTATQKFAAPAVEWYAAF